MRSSIGLKFEVAYFKERDIVVAIVIHQNLLHEPLVNRESHLFEDCGLLRHTANGQTKVSPFVRMEFGGLAGSPLRGVSEVRGSS